MSRSIASVHVPLGTIANCQYGLSEPADPNGDRLYIGMGQLQNGCVVPTNANRLTVSDKIAARYGLHRGDVLFNRTNSLELVGKTAIVNDDALEGSVFASYLVRLQVDAKKYDSRFLALWMNTSDSVRRLRRLATAGVAQYNIRPSLLAAKFLVPAWPLPKQRTVADIDELFTRLSSMLDAQVGAKYVFRRGLSQQLLAGQRRFPKFRSRSWSTAALGDVVTHKPRKVSKPSGTFLSAGVRSHGKGVFLKEEFSSDQIALDELFELKHDDLVVNITFGWEGAVAIVPPNADGALVSHRFPTYQVDQNKILLEYLRHVIRTRRFVSDVGIASPGGAGRNRVLNRREFLEIPLHLPCIDEQQEIANTLNGVDREIDLLEQLNQNIRMRKRAILSRLLSGEISIPSP